MATGIYIFYIAQIFLMLAVHVYRERFLPLNRVQLMCQRVSLTTYVTGGLKIGLLSL